MDNNLRKLKAELRQILDGDDMDCVSDRTGNSDDYCAGFVDGMNDALNQLAAGIGTLLEEKDKRIAELEAIATEYAGKFQKAQDAAKHLVIMNDSAQAEIAHLKTLLATPVRLPKRWDVSGQVTPPRIVQVQFEQQNRTHDQCAEAIRAAGFTVEIDI